ncbi:pleiotropic drug resistance protein 3-like [Gossypium australe]|uniref:Pleiotropic drug resistance protein 3-like n=1 Tax=Gossypium australe TaxID=47621 RepID=A0A5B6X5S7_9ROSI|nr:pleiotropic drug resistance protein 3-like [Gossypium australe]
MAADASNFKNVDKRFHSKVKVGNGQYIEAVRNGDVLIKTASGTKLVTDVLLVLDIDQNLLSVGQLLEKNYSVIFKDNKWLILDLSRCELISTKLADRIAYTSSLNETKLWHKRIGHVDYKSLSLMSKNNLVENLSKMVDHEDTRSPFLANTTWRATEKLHLVHNDICRPMKTSSLNRSRYFVLFIDDSTRFCQVYFMKNKSEVVEIFFKFKVMVENQSDCKLKMVRLDNEAEYTSRSLKSSTKSLNRTVMNMARCLLFESKLPDDFWAETINTAAYLLN